MRSGKALLVLALLLLPNPALAAWTAVGTIMNANNGTAATTYAPVTSDALEAGNVGICVMAKDETGTGTTTPTAQVTSVTDAVGNTWNEAIDWCNMRTATAADGACVAVYWTLARETLPSGGAMTWTFAASTTRKGVTCMEYTTTGIPAVVALAAGSNGAATTAADPGSLTDATTVNRAHLFIRGTSCETNTTTYTADTDYVAFTGHGTNSTSNSGTAATSITSRGEHRIATESTSAASDPTLAAADCASVMVALDEDVATIRRTAQVVSNVASPATSVALAMPGSVTSGNVVVVGCVRDSTASDDPFVVGDIAKTAGTSTVGSFQLDAVVSAVQSGGTNYHTSGLFSVKVTGTGTLTITVSDDGSQYFFCAAQEYTGMDGTTWKAGSSTGTSTTGAPTTGTYAGTDQILFVGMVGTQTLAATTHTAGLDFVSVAESQNGAANMTGAMEDRSVSTTTTDAADWVAPTTVYWVATLAAYQDTIAAAGCAQSIALMGVGCR